MKKIFILLILLCSPTLAMSDAPPKTDVTTGGNTRVVELHWAADGYEDLCQEALDRHKNKTLGEIYIGSMKENYKVPFFVDIDNNGIKEKLKYFSANRYLTLAEIYEGKRHGFSSPAVRTAFYSGNYMIRFNNKNYLLHLDNIGPIEIQSVERIIISENEDKVMYRNEVLCKYHPD